MPNPYRKRRARPIRANRRRSADDTVLAGLTIPAVRPAALHRARR
jgi:hypothetical protein